MSSEHLAAQAIASPGKWHGGKGAFNGALAKWIVTLMPTHTHYVEPYFGMGNVLLAKKHNGVSEAVNDVHRELTNWWRVLAYEATFAAFRRIIEATPFSGVEWEQAGQHSIGDPVHRAVKFFVRCRMSLAGRCDTFAPLSRTRTRGGMNEQASAWLSAVDGLPEVHARMKRVVILPSMNALDVIRTQDGPNTLFYLDPPYLHETRAAKQVYDHEMLRDDHIELLAVLANIQGKFLLSGYRSILYDRFSDECGWHRSEYLIANCAASGLKKRTMLECVWTNFAPNLTPKTEPNVERENA